MKHHQHMVQKEDMFVSTEKNKIEVGDVVTLKKPHPCGAERWEVLRIGADFRLRCMGCERTVMLPRRKVERAVKKIEK